MTKVIVKIEHEGKEYNATIQTIESVSVYLERGLFVSLSICVDAACLSGFILDRLDTEAWEKSPHLSRWVRAVFKLTGKESFKDAEGMPILAIWDGDGYAGDRLIGLAKPDGSFVFIPAKQDKD